MDIEYSGTQVPDGNLEVRSEPTGSVVNPPSNSLSFLFCHIQFYILLITHLDGKLKIRVCTFCFVLSWMRKSKNY